MSAILIIVLAPFLMGNSTCTGTQIKDEPLYMSLAYGAGAGIAGAVINLVPDSDSQLGRYWNEMMQKTGENEAVSSEDLALFYNQSLLTFAGYTNDPHGVIQHLSALTLIFGAQFNEAGQMTFIQPVPVNVMKWFQTGYITQRRIELAKIARENK